MVGLSGAVIRIQQFLISPSMEVDAVSILKSITPSLEASKHKGQAGKIAVVGGCREYTGAPYFSAISALKIGADLSHVFCTKDAAPVIKGYSPVLIVHPILEESYSVRDEDEKSILEKVIEEVDKWMERFDCLVIGPGLGRDPFLLVEKNSIRKFDCVSNIMKHARQSNVPMVIDGDGLFLVTNSLDLISGYPLAVLTPNVNEIEGATIFRKGVSDFISNGETVHSVSSFGSPRRCGGQGDILSGSVAVFVSWARQLAGEPSMSATVMGCIAGSVVLRKAASQAFERNRRSMLTIDIIQHLGTSLEELCPVLVSR
ncbi:hypothetical protein SASPL_112314 [Salvia splendens]|uniref:ATP-dependent (S)-NAD(P)H-hydrate dehydratase n=1 Tax=Salvia splendens TaxID=180675 RepID=A0A8X8Y9T1_SALSN|nr:hypothetical protein SASPL_112314 [Salvia splendens]